jgi:RNA polymerase sigma-70 factor (ECF subfamily)
VVSVAEGKAGVDDEEPAYEHFFARHEPRLRRALTAAYGPNDGSDAAAAALAYAWEHWEQVSVMQNPAGYLYRVGQSAARRRRRPHLDLPRPADDSHEFEPGLVDALRGLTEHQRVTVLLVHGYEWTYAEVAELLEVSVSTVRNHLRRGLEHLQRALGVELDA